MRNVGGFLGTTPTSASANGGSYLLSEQFNFQLSNKWPGNLITNGLRLLLDGFNTNSYPGTGTTWFDVSGNGVNATIVGSPTFTNGYFSITSDSTYISVPNSTLQPRTDDFTYSTWVYFNSTDSLDTIFENGSWTDTLLFRYESSQFTIHAESAYRGAFAWTSVLNTWLNIVLKRESNTLSCFINNVSIGTPFTLNVDINLAVTTMILMRSQHASGQWTNGRMSLFSVYNRALSNAEIQTNFNALKGRYGL